MSSSVRRKGQDDKPAPQREKSASLSGQTVKSDFMNQWQRLWAEDRPFFRRVLTAVFPCVLLTFILFFFGPLDIFLSNDQYFSIDASAFIFPFLLLFLGVSVVLCILISALRGKVFNASVCLVFGLALCCYLQSMCFNIDLGALNGTTIQWQNYTIPALVNLFVWGFIIFAVFILAFLFRSYFKQAMAFVCVLLFLMQLSSLIVSIVTDDQDSDFFLSGEDEYTLSGDENIVVFVLDSYSNTIFNDIAASDPSVSDDFKDFVYFDNYSCGYMGTFPGELHMITGYLYDFGLTYRENFDAAWSSELTNKYFNELKAAGYEMRFFSNGPGYFCNTEAQMQNSFSNIVSGGQVDVKISIHTMLQFIQLSLFRYAPQSMKACFWMYSGDISVVDSIETEYNTFISALRNIGLSTVDGSKYISYYMLPGVHPPHVFDANGNYVPDGTSKKEQAIAYLRACEEYIQQMKNLGIYDSSTIIITSDHGDITNLTDTQPLFLIKEKNSHGEALEYNHAPAAQLDFRSTVLRCAGLDYSEFGPSVFDFDEEDSRERTTYLWKKDKNYPPLGKYYNVMYEYNYTGDGDTISDMIESGKYTVHKLIDSFYG